MSESKRNTKSNFQSEDEAFEYLVQESQNKILKEQWKKELDQLPDAPEEKKGVARKVYFRRSIAMAASFILLLGAFYWFTQREISLPQMAEAMIAETNFVLENGSATRGTETTEESDLDIALREEINEALEKKDYKACIGLFATKEKNNRLSVNDKFFYALSLARVDNADHHKAIRLLDDVTRQKENYYNEALWLQALLFLKIEEPYKSKILLNKLINNSNYQITNTKALLERMAD